MIKRNTSYLFQECCLRIVVLFLLKMVMLKLYLKLKQEYLAVELLRNSEIGLAFRKCNALYLYYCSMQFQNLIKIEEIFQMRVEFFTQIFIFGRAFDKFVFETVDLNPFCLLFYLQVEEMVFQFVLFLMCIKINNNQIIYYFFSGSFYINY